MKMFRAIGIVLLSMAATTAYGIDLEEMQARALGNRQVIQQYMTALEQSREDTRIAKGGYYPSVNVAYTVNKLDEDSTTEHKDNSVVYGEVTYNIFSGYLDKYGVQSTELLEKIEGYKLGSARQDIQLSVALAYLKVYTLRANTEVSRAAYQTLEKVYKDGESRYQVGLIGKNELLKFRVDYDNADITLKKAEADLKKSINDLSRQMGQRIQLSELDFAEFSSLPDMVELDLYRERMLADRSEIKSMEALIEVNGVAVNMQKAAYYPKVDLAGSYLRYDNDFINGAGDVEEDEARAQLKVSMNLFQGYATDAEVAKAKLEIRSARYELAELKDTLINQLDNLFIDHEVSLKNVDVAIRSIEQAEENLRITQLKYDEGLQRESDLLDAITSLSRAKYNHVAVVATAFNNDFQITRMVDGFGKSQ